MKIPVTKTLGSITQSNIVRKTSNMIANNAGKFAVATILIKDGINTYYYYNQSLNNEKIPESKRKFVASLDLINGIMNQVGQLTIGSLIASRKCQGYMTSKLMGKWIKRVESNILPAQIKEIKKNKGIVKVIKIKGVKGAKATKEYKAVEYNVNDKTIEELYEKSDKTEDFTIFKEDKKNLVEFSRVGIDVITSLGITTTVGKRMLTPLIATPLAGWYKDKFLPDKPGFKAYTVPEQKLDENNAIAFYRQLRNNHLRKGQ